MKNDNPIKNWANPDTFHSETESFMGIFGVLVIILIALTIVGIITQNRIDKNITALENKLNEEHTQTIVRSITP